MVKLRLLNVVLFSALALNAQPLQPPSPGNGKKQGQGRDAQGKPPQPQPAPLLQGTQASPLWVNVIQAGTDQPAAKTDTQSANHGSTSKWRRDPNWWVAGFTLILAFIAGIQAWLFVRQLKIMKKSLDDSKTAAETARDAANAAQKGAETAMIAAKQFASAERPWMLITHNAALGHQGGEITFVAVNRGRSPARILRAEMHNTLCDFDNPHNFIDYWDEQFIYKHQEWTIVGDPVLVDSFSLAKFRDRDRQGWEDVTSHKKRLWLHGIVRYADGLTTDIHTSKFCYQYISGELSGLVMDGPEGANSCT
jgi:hypothetical protein